MQAHLWHLTCRSLFHDEQECFPMPYSAKFRKKYKVFLFVSVYRTSILTQNAQKQSTYWTKNIAAFNFSKYTQIFSLKLLSTAHFWASKSNQFKHPFITANIQKKISLLPYYTKVQDILEGTLSTYLWLTLPSVSILWSLERSIFEKHLNEILIGAQWRNFLPSRELQGSLFFLQEPSSLTFPTV